MFSEAVSDLKWAWRSLAYTDLAYKILAFAVLSPAVALVLRWLLTRRQGPVVADVDILWFFVTTRSGVLVLVLGGALLTGITALELSCLMAVGISASERKHLLPRHALAFGGGHAGNVVRLTLQMVLRVLAVLVPVGSVAAVTYMTLLHGHDINFYLARRPPEFWAAAAIVAVMVIALVALVLRTVARWAFALPLVLFEGVSPRRALGEAGRRSQGHRGAIVGTLALWAALAITLAVLATKLPEAIGRWVAPQLHASLSGLTVFVVLLALLLGALTLLAAVFNVSLFSLLVIRLYRRYGTKGEIRLPAGVVAGTAPDAYRHRRLVLAGIAVVAVVVITSVTLLTAVASSRDYRVLVIAHRGASWDAPENTMSAFRIAAEQKADFIELDVQESADGEVLVVHDSDMMRVGGFPTKIWEGSAEELRAIPIAWRTGSEPAERLPTLAETLAFCKGRCKLIVELKSYGHNVSLEEKVVALVEQAGMVDDCIFMSLDHDMVHKMKQLRPSWRSGVLVAKAMGDLSKFDADFYAVEAKLATRRFVRRAHAENREVYVWTVNDPPWMLSAMSRGVDGLITDRPDVARAVVAKRAAMSDGERLLMALLVRVGARPENLRDI